MLDRRICEKASRARGSALRRPLLHRCGLHRYLLPTDLPGGAPSRTEQALLSPVPPPRRKPAFDPVFVAGRRRHREPPRGSVPVSPFAGVSSSFTMARSTRAPSRSLRVGSGLAPPSSPVVRRASGRVAGGGCPDPPASLRQAPHRRDQSPDDRGRACRRLQERPAFQRHLPSDVRGVRRLSFASRTPFARRPGAVFWLNCPTGRRSTGSHGSTFTPLARWLAWRWSRAASTGVPFVGAMHWAP